MATVSSNKRRGRESKIQEFFKRCFLYFKNISFLSDENADFEVAQRSIGVDTQSKPAKKNLSVQ